MWFHRFVILATSVAMVSANMSMMLPPKERLDTLVRLGSINERQKHIIVDLVDNDDVLNQHIVDREKETNKKRIPVDEKNAAELLSWIDQEVSEGDMNEETAKYLSHIFFLPSRYQEPAVRTERDGPVQKVYQDNGIVTRLAWLNYDPGVGNNFYNGIWGYATGDREYALQTNFNGLHIFDVTNAANNNIVKLQTISMAGGSVWRDVAVTMGHAYVGAQNSQGIGDALFYAINLEELSGNQPHAENSNPISQNNINTIMGYSSWGHTINAWKDLVFLNSANGGGGKLGCKIFSVLDDPLSPTEIGHYTAGDCHDSFAKTLNYKGEERDFLFTADGYTDTYRIHDITDIRENNFTWKKIGQTPSMGQFYAHENAVSDDGKTLFVFDEFNVFDIAAFDISSDAKLENPVLLSKFQYSGHAQAGAVVHNGFVRRNYLYVAYYEAGLRVFDISDVNNIIEVGKLDTYIDPDGDGNADNGIANKYEGAWNVYLDLPSGRVLISDLRYGLFVVDIDETASPTYAPTDSPTGNPTNAPMDNSTENPTNAPTESPTDNPTNAPIASPTKLCKENMKWKYKGKKNQNCAWVSLKPNNRCKNKSDNGVIAEKACPIACGRTDCRMPVCWRGQRFKPKKKTKKFKKCSNLSEMKNSKKRKYCRREGADKEDKTYKVFAYEVCKECKVYLNNCVL